MALVDEFAALYTNHVYKNGISVSSSPADPDGLKNPRGLARAVNNGGGMPAAHRQYPYETGVDPTTSTLLFSLGNGPSDAARDALPPSYLLEHTIPTHLKQQMIDANYINKNKIVGTNIRRLGTVGISQLRVQGRVP